MLLLAAVLAAAAGGGCSESETAVLDFDLVGDVVADTGPFRIQLEAPVLDTYFQATRQNSSILWVGSERVGDDAVGAKALMRFAVALPDSARVIADTLALVCDLGGDYGDPAAQSAGVEEITAASWYEDPSTDYPFDAHRALDPDVSLVIEDCSSSIDADGTFDATTIKVVLPTSLAQGWADDPETANHGLALVPRGAEGGFKRFQFDRSEMILAYTVGGDTTRIVLDRLEHATIYSLNPQLESDGSGTETYALVAGPYDYRGVLQFDLGELPVDASINKLDLRLTLDPAVESHPDAADTVEVGLHELISIPGEALDGRPTVSFFSNPVTTQLLVLDGQQQQVTIDVSEFGDEVRNGILIKASGDFPSLAQFGIVTREAAVDSLRPQLDVVYTLPPRPRL